jgi:hypothetical protein
MLSFNQKHNKLVDKRPRTRLNEKSPVVLAINHKITYVFPDIINQ